MKKRNIFLFSLIIISLSILGLKIIDDIHLKQQNNILVESYFEKKEENKLPKESYLGILELPTINLKRGFFAYSSKLNKVDQNIEVVSPNCLPNAECNFVLASHSGTSNIAFFKHLDLLKIGDNAILYYMDHQTTYTLIKKERTIKNGTITLSKNNQKTLVLTTCNKENKNLQDIYYFQ